MALNKELFLMYRVELKETSRILLSVCLKTLFLMYRVELKGSYCYCHPIDGDLFLMYRVELKGLPSLLPSRGREVPNVPCGVESHCPAKGMGKDYKVPNVPCGVERVLMSFLMVVFHARFLMYRVELKDIGLKLGVSPECKSS